MNKISNGERSTENERYNGSTKAIEIKNLNEYFTNLTSKGIAEQYNSLKFGPSKSTEIGKKAENKMKNRYMDLLPYDDTRVILKNHPKENSEVSDYINANYIDGYKKAKAYISTQGPLERTIIDFWHMIWQEKACKIIMAANIIEDCKKKCEKYWPDTTASYGDITITLQSEKCYLDYTIRNFLLHHKDGTSRHIRQYHFTAWPDHGVPLYPLSLVMLLKAAKKYQPFCEAPLVLHCSAGVGRSGTVMLLDAAIDMAENEGYVDIVSMLAKMRQSRSNLVETVEQFTFVYRALVDYFCGEVTQKSCDEFQTYYNLKESESSKTLLKQQFERLKALISVETSSLSVQSRFYFKAPNSLTGETAHNSDNCKQELNHFYVNGHGKRNAYIVIQYPKVECIHEFWQLAYDVESRIIIVFGHANSQENKYPTYWPESNTLHQGNLKIDYITSELNFGVLIHTFNLRNSVEPQTSRVIKQCHILDWDESEDWPPPKNTIINLFNALETSLKGKPVLIVYKNNPCCAGFICASWIIYRQVIEDRLVDVFTAVRTIRRNQPSFINSLESYQKLYDLASSIVNENNSKL
ncbi:receptor-type tyrosine-protein phosphatase kappa-like [Centruroides sculpturatus]|uniref:receptor-type tyrosine-protein phosphatase kappa-like n=1 Tax=Centruroides sculpturatus TaxID=218467 RepID=UPI000C6E8E21|nr:receptor-type tyrosine-protein phosphatase kappa-like [Centruroides sculpturatus]